MPTPEQEAAVTNDLIQIFRERYGDDNLMLHFKKNLAPSPLQEIATRNHVSLHYVRKCRSTLMHIGLLADALLNPTPEVE